MQKKLIALAVAGLASSAAFAQSNVTIYGLLQPSYDFMDTDAADKTTDMTWNNSRIGFKGSEDLGNGLKAIFQIESKVEFTEKAAGADSFGDRDSWVGLAGSFGSFTFGNHQSAYVKVAASYDPFADSIADYNNIMGLYSVSQGGGEVDFNNRWTKSAYYTSPKFSGFQVVASHSLNGQNNSDATKAAQVYSIAGNYSNGGLGLFAAYENQGQPQSSGDDIVGWKLGASYKFGTGTKLSGIYENLSQDNSVLAGGADADSDRYFVAVTHPISSNLDIAATYIHAGEAVNNGNDGARNWNLGLNYKLSKRTSVQGLYTNLNNKANGRYFIDSNGYAGGAAGDDVSGFSVRLKHSF